MTLDLLSDSEWLFPGLYVSTAPSCTLHLGSVGPPACSCLHPFAVPREF